MRGEHLLEKIGLADHAWVTDAEKIRKKPRYVIWWRSIAAAVAAACIAMGCYMFSDSYLFRDEHWFGSEEEVLKIAHIIVEDHWASYKVIGHTDMQERMLSLKKGERYAQFGETVVYRYAGRDDLVYLILEREDNLDLVEFDRFYTHASGSELLESDWYEVEGKMRFGPELVTQITPITSVGEVLRLIYHVEDVRDIQSLTFIRDNLTSNGIAEERTTVRDVETLSAFYRILASLEYQENVYDIPISEKHAERIKLSKELDVDSIHLTREIKCKLKNGYELKMIYHGYDGALTFPLGIRLDDVANDWFVEQGEIDFTCQDRREEPIGEVGETETARPMKTASDSSEDKTTTGSPPVTSES